MKKTPIILTFLTSILFAAGSMAQTNKIGPTDNIGIGTTNPVAPLDVYAGPLPVPPPIFAPLGVQARVSSNISGSFWAAHAFSAEQTGSKIGNFSTLWLASTSSNPTGSVQGCISLEVLHNHTGAGALGSVAVADARLEVNPGTGNITTATCFSGTIFIPNGQQPTNTIQNGYGLFISTFSSNVINRYGVYIQDPAAGNYLAGTLNVGTTTLPAGYQMAVNGSALFTKVVVKTGWADYVFNKNYQLPSLDSVARYVKENNHLAEIPSAVEVEKSGVDVGANQALLLKKVEELTLYLIQQNDQLKLQQREIKSLRKELKILSSRK